MQVFFVAGIVAVYVFGGQCCSSCDSPLISFPHGLMDLCVLWLPLFWLLRVVVYIRGPPVGQFVFNVLQQWITCVTQLHLRCGLSALIASVKCQIVVSHSVRHCHANMLLRVPEISGVGLGRFRPSLSPSRKQQLFAKKQAN